MTTSELDVLKLASSANQDEEFSIPLCIEDLIKICKEYNRLGWQMQNQVEAILEFGVEESIQAGFVKKESLPHIKSFLKEISRNVYFGDAVSQAHDCIQLIHNYQEKNKDNLILN